MSIEIKISKRPISYKYAINFLQKRVKDIKNKKCNELLWVLEHPTTFTAGIRSEKKEILDKRINIISTNRGGKITLHNPGQKIIYFVLDLNNRKKDLRKLISTIEKSIIEFLNFYDLKGIADRKNIGVWVNKRKIAAIGIKVSRWIAYHGCSININNNLKKYLKIAPCGLDNNKITSILNEKKIIKKNNNKKLINIFLKNFKNF
jgi:lipoyl(octanoyl) transferase|tara:strand:+ start:46 stop:657 length:612 start_codon:yes stop_codon:yes gene_type:complete